MNSGAAELWREFLRLTEEQSSFIGARDADGLNESLSRRAELILRIDALAEAVETEELRELREKIRDINGKNQADTRRWLAEIDGEIQSASANRRGVLGYTRRELDDFTNILDEKC
ncbi:MAG: flagellar protein FliT [Oscillospiraceae bacterium]|jgi:hypothetical protein|nr:flagellar protein FliT [Oscillospiraceae bacterium]